MAETPSPTPPDSFESQAAAPERSTLRELWAFMRDNKKWWLAPIVVVVLLIGVILILGATSAAPFIYTLF